LDTQLPCTTKLLKAAGRMFSCSVGSHSAALVIIPCRLLSLPCCLRPLPSIVQLKSSHLLQIFDSVKKIYAPQKHALLVVLENCRIKNLLDCSTTVLNRNRCLFSTRSQSFCAARTQDFNAVVVASSPPNIITKTMAYAESDYGYENSTPQTNVRSLMPLFPSV